MSFKLVNNTKDYVKCISKSNFVSHEIFSKNFVAKNFEQTINV